MITKDMIEKGYDLGVITLEEDPNARCGTICKIGKNWFYFGGITAEGMDPEEYRQFVPTEDIVDEIFMTLNGGFKEDSPSEYAYYEEYLTKKLSCWAEIACWYLCEDDKFWRVDAWRTNNDAEEGKVIAYIDDLTGRVLYIDPLASVDAHAQKVISAKVNEIESKIDKKLRERFKAFSDNTNNFRRYPSGGSPESKG